MQTTIIGVEFNGGVVLGADSRTTTGSYVANRVSDKITGWLISTRKTVYFSVTSAQYYARITAL